MNVDISFIVPIYNKMKSQIDRCLLSILNVKNIRFEILLIDDGSDVELSKLYKSYASKTNIRYFYQTNQGVSAARNLGIAKAKGKYLMFVDADDYIIPQVLDKKDLNKNKELIIFNVDKKNMSRGKEEVFKLPTIKGEPSNDSLLKLTLSDGLLNWSVSKLYLKDYIEKKGIRFSTEISTGEDLDFIINCLKNNPNVMYINKVLYVYIYSDSTGLSRILNNPQRAINDIVNVWQERKKVLSYLNNINRSSLKNNINEDYLNSLFEVFAILLFYRKSKNTNIKKVYKEIKLRIEKSAINYEQISYKIKFKYFLFKNKKYKLIYTYYALKVIIKKVLATILDRKLGYVKSAK